MRFVVRPIIGPLLMSGVCLVAAQNATDDEFPESELIAGKRTLEPECVATTHAVWVEHREGSECIRYFPSSGIDGAKAAVFFFHGDRISGRFVERGAYRDNKASILIKASENLAKVNRVPYILVGRPGTYGSSGRHTESRALKEYLTLDAAVTVIKARHGIEKVHLGGQSGGATAVGALLTLGRDDVVCAVAASGGYNALARAQDSALQKGLTWRGCDTNGVCNPYNVVDHVAGVRESAERRVFLIGDPQDGNTAYRYQQEFADKLHARGHVAELVPATANDAQHHSLAHMANRALGWCNAALPTSEVVQLIRAGAYGLADVRATK